MEHHDVLAVSPPARDELESGKLASRLTINRIPQTCYVCSISIILGHNARGERDIALSMSG